MGIYFESLSLVLMLLKISTAIMTLTLLSKMGKMDLIKASSALKCLK